MFDVLTRQKKRKKKKKKLRIFFTMQSMLWHFSESSFYVTLYVQNDIRVQSEHKKL